MEYLVYWLVLEHMDKHMGKFQDMCNWIEANNDWTTMVEYTKY